MVQKKQMIWAARIVSIVFTPFYLPITGLVALYVFSYLSMLPWVYKLTSLVLVWLFTVMLPSLLIRLYRNYHGWTLFQLGTRERLIVPYVISICCYFACYYLMNLYHMPHFIGAILIAALGVQVLCALINVWWKISIHTAAIGGVTGGLLAFALIFNFNPLWWLCLVIFLGGVVGTSRMILRQHSLSQVTGGFLTGMLIAFFLILL
jgi:membrane-associated phospholipid phosphatase